jgi:hypothetical protein
VPELSADVDIGGLGSHGETDNQCALDQFVGIATQNFSIFAGARLRLVGVDD